MRLGCCAPPQNDGRPRGSNSRMVVIPLRFCLAICLPNEPYDNNPCQRMAAESERARAAEYVSGPAHQSAYKELKYTKPTCVCFHSVACFRTTLRDTYANRQEMKNRKLFFPCCPSLRLAAGRTRASKLPASFFG